MKKDSAMIIGSYLAIYLVWGSTYYFIKLSVETVPPLYVLGFRFLFGGVLLLGISLIGRRVHPLPTLKEVGSALLLGVLLLLVGNGLVTMAEREVDSYLVALLLASTPVVVAFFNRVIFKIRITPLRVAGILVGVSGVGLLLYDGRSFVSSMSPEMLMAIGGLLSWSFATSLGHRLKVYKDSMVNSAMQMLFIGVLSFAGMLLAPPPFSEVVTRFSTSSMIGVIYLAVIGSLAFSAYNYLLAHEPSIRIVSYAFVNPVIAVLIGILIGKEKVVPYLYLGLPLILFGLFMMFYGGVLLKKLRFRKGR